MPNAMDSILVKYGTPVTEVEQNLIDYSFLKRKVTKGVKTVTIPEFLKVPRNKLSEMEQKIQQAIQLVYDLNAKAPPLYQKFPDFRPDKPLTIDITISGKEQEDYSAVYRRDNNVIVFEEARYPEELVESLAHELKHAEQCDEKIYQLHGELFEKNAYGWHQLRFLEEAQACICGARAYYEICPKPNIGNYGYRNIDLYAELSKKYILPNGQKDYKKIEKEMIKQLLPQMYNGGYYKKRFDKAAPIGDKDTGLDHIPAGFHVSQTLMDHLKQVPREAFFPEGQMFQCIKNKNWEKCFSLLESFNIPTLKDIFDKFHFQKGAEKLTWYLCTMTRKGRSIFPAKDIVEVLPYILSGIDISDQSVPLQITEKDLMTQYGNNRLFINFNPKSHDFRLSRFIKILPVILKLKGKDHKPLVGEKEWVQQLNYWMSKMDRPQNFQKLLNALTDEKGCLPLPREAFDIRDSKSQNGQNWLLTRFCLTNHMYKNRRDYYSALLPTLMTLKDNQGRPIISKENIRRFPKENPFSEAIKAYLPKQKTGLKKRLRKGEEEAVDTFLSHRSPKRP